MYAKDLGISIEAFLQKEIQASMNDKTTIRNLIIRNMGMFYLENDKQGMLQRAETRAKRLNTLLRAFFPEPEMPQTKPLRAPQWSSNRSGKKKIAQLYVDIPSKKRKRKQKKQRSPESRSKKQETRHAQAESSSEYLVADDADEFLRTVSVPPLDGNEEPQEYKGLFDDKVPDCLPVSFSEVPSYSSTDTLWVNNAGLVPRLWKEFTVPHTGAWMEIFLFRMVRESITCSLQSASNGSIMLCFGTLPGPYIPNIGLQRILFWNGNTANVYWRRGRRNTGQDIKFNASRVAG